MTLLLEQRGLSVGLLALCAGSWASPALLKLFVLEVV